MKNKIRLYGISILLLFLSNILFAQHFTTVWSGNPNSPMAFIILSADINGTALGAGDEIAVFDVDGADEICVGAIVLTGPISGSVTFSAATDDPLTPGVKDGFTPGNAIIYRFWDSSENMEVTVITPTYVPGFDEVYTSLGTADISSLAGSVTFWTGATDNDWHTGSNWSTAVVPGSGEDLLIPIGLTNYPTLSAAGTCKNITLQSDATGNASIIGNNNLTVQALSNVYRYFSGYSGGSNGWHNISSPVDNMTIAGSDFHFTTADNDDLYQWDEPSSMWENYKGTNTFPNFENGHGYLCALETSGTLSFVGTLNESDVPLTSDLSYDGDSWHLRGNPFASAIEWNNGDWVVTGIAATAKIWDESGGTYVDITSGGIIPSTNGFFVEVADATNELTIPASARVHDATNNYKKASESELPETLVLTITNDENPYYDVNRVGFKAQATEDWDYEFDSHKLFGEETAPQLWTVTNEDIFSLNYLPYTTEAYQVQLNFRAGVNTTYLIETEGLESFGDDIEIFLEDLETGSTIDLNEQQNYQFTATTEDDENRFLIHFNGLTNTIENPVNSDFVNIYSHDQTVYFHFKEVNQINSMVEIFNTMGQLVISKDLEPGKIKSVLVEDKPGVYIVRLKNENHYVTQKVTLN